MAKRRTKVAAAAVLALCAVFASTFCAAPLHASPALAAPLPSASPPAEMKLFHLPTGVTHRSAWFAIAAGRCATSATSR